MKRIKNQNNRRALNVAKNNHSKKFSLSTPENFGDSVYGQAGLHFSFKGQTSANAGSPINKNYAPRTLFGIHAVMGPLKVQKEGPTWEDCLRDHSSSSALLVWNDRVNFPAFYTRLLGHRRREDRLLRWYEPIRGLLRAIGSEYKRYVVKLLVEVSKARRELQWCLAESFVS